jgi:hypothetical protein
MNTRVSVGCLVGLCFSMAAAIGGGLYEGLVLVPLWTASPPSSFSVIQPETGVPLQRFWLPVHGAITLFLIAGLVATWKGIRVRRIMLVGTASYVVMRVWSGLFFIPEMLAFQQIPLDSPPSAELSARVGRWLSLTVWREPLDVLSFLSFLLALYWFGRPASPIVGSDSQ